MKRFDKSLLVWFFIFFITFSGSGFASTNRIRSIKFEGNSRIDTVILESYLEIKKGNVYSREKVNETVKKLYKSGLFEDVTTKYSNGRLVFIIKENPIISEIFFEGNNKLDSEILEQEISLTKRSVFTKAKLKKDIERINDIYRKSGRFLAKTEAKIIKEKNNRVKLIFEINEGKKAKVKKITIVGNKKFSDDNLKDVLLTKEAKYLRFSAGEVYDPERLEYDKELLRRFYYSKGYADFEVLSIIGEITPERDGFYVTILVEEGVKYKFGEFQVINNIKKFDKSVVEKKIKLRTGKTFNADLMNKTTDSMIEEMGKYGYAFVDVEPRMKKNKETRIIDIDFIIHPTRKIYIGRINIVGNTRTLDEVIRRELRIQEGDPYNNTKIQRSLQRIRNLGYFKDVKITKTQGITRNQMDLTIHVVEQKTGELNFGIGYSTVDGANVNAGIKEKNVLGTGRKVSFNWTYSEFKERFDFGYGKPYFLDRELFAGFDVFHSKEDDQDSIKYDRVTFGGSFNTSYSITEYLSQKLYYSYFEEDIKNISPDYTGIVEEKNTVTSLMGQSLMYDKRDNVYDPRQGFYLKWSLDYAGVGGDKNYVSNIGNGAVYVPTFFDDVVFKVGARGGHIDGIGEPVDTNDGFFLGGYSLKGFEYAGVGPRTKDAATGSPHGGSAVGGREYYVGEAEFRFPLGLPKEYRIFGSLFANAGTVTGIDDNPKINKASIEDSGSIRSAYGFSISWRSPIGPISLDFAETIKKETYDIGESFRFSFGSNF